MKTEDILKELLSKYSVNIGFKNGEPIRQAKEKIECYYGTTLTSQQNVLNDENFEVRNR